MCVYTKLFNGDIVLTRKVTVTSLNTWYYLGKQMRLSIFHTVGEEPGRTLCAYISPLYGQSLVLPKEYLPVLARSARVRHRCAIVLLRLGVEDFALIFFCFCAFN